MFAKLMLFFLFTTAANSQETKKDLITNLMGILTGEGPSSYTITSQPCPNFTWSLTFIDRNSKVTHPSCQQALLLKSWISEWLAAYEPFAKNLSSRINTLEFLLVDQLDTAMYMHEQATLIMPGTLTSTNSSRNPINLKPILLHELGHALQEHFFPLKKNSSDNNLLLEEALKELMADVVAISLSHNPQSIWQAAKDVKLLQGKSISDIETSEEIHYQKREKKRAKYLLKGRDFSWRENSLDSVSAKLKNSSQAAVQVYFEPHQYLSPVRYYLWSHYLSALPSTASRIPAYIHCLKVLVQVASKIERELALKGEYVQATTDSFMLVNQRFLQELDKAL
jgi:hypothetical protein